MARKTVQQYFSDLSGDEIEGGSPTVKFVFDGTGYEVDLTEQERDAFEEAVKPYVAVGRKSSVARGSSSRGSSGGSSGPDAKTVRAWAQGEGLEVPARGRVPASVIEAYQAAN